MSKEFVYIKEFLQPLSGAGSHNLLDDTATIGKYSISTDTIISGVHFVGTESPESLAIKLLSVNLSDLASVGAVPKFYSLNVSLPKSLGEDWWQKFTTGLKYIQGTYNITLLGGDSTTGTSEIVLSATVWGKSIQNPPLRCNAKADDIVCMVGTVGAGAFGLLSATGKIDDNECLQHYQMPIPQTKQGQALAPIVNAMADVSDGIIADCFHIATASNIGMTLNINDIALHPSVKKHSKTIDNVTMLALTGGDDYILVCTMSEDNFDRAKKIVPELKKIGITTTDTNCIVVDNNDNIIDFKGKYGYEHF